MLRALRSLTLGQPVVVVFEVPAQFGQGSFSDVSFSKREFWLRCSFEMKAVLPTVWLIQTDNSTFI